mgnify:CR=1 FL=1
MKDVWQARQIYEDDKVRAIEEAWKDLDLPVDLPTEEKDVLIGGNEPSRIQEGVQQTISPKAPGLLQEIPQEVVKGASSLPRYKVT